MLLITVQPIRNLRTPASADMNKRGFLEQASPSPLPNPPPLFPFLPISYPLPLSTPATQAIFYSIQLFLNAEGQNTAITIQTKHRKRGNCRRFEKMPPIRNGFATKAIRRGSAFLEVCSRNSAYVLRCNDRQQELHDRA